MRAPEIQLICSSSGSHSETQVPERTHTRMHSCVHTSAHTNLSATNGVGFAVNELSQLTMVANQMM